MTSMFEQASETTEVQPDEDGNYLNVIVGEGRKWATPEDLAKGAVHSQVHIQQIEAENAQLRQEMATVRSVEEILAESQAAPNAESNQENQSGEQEQSGTTFTQDDIEKIVSDRLLKVEQGKAQENNAQLVANSLTKVHGDQAGKVFETKAKELGMEVKALEAMASSNPQVVIGLFNQTKPQQNSMFNNTQSSEAIDGSKLTMNQTSFNNPQAVGAKPNSFWEKKRAENNGRLNPNDAAKEMADSVALGNEFFIN